MKSIFIVIGVILTALSVYYFIRLAYLIFNSNEMTNYGYGILAGKSILLVVGLIFLYLGFKKKK